MRRKSIFVSSARSSSARLRTAPHSAFPRGASTPHTAPRVTMFRRQSRVAASSRKGANAWRKATRRHTARSPVGSSGSSPTKRSIASRSAAPGHSSIPVKSPASNASHGTGCTDGAPSRELRSAIHSGAQLSGSPITHRGPGAVAAAGSSAGPGSSTGAWRRVVRRPAWSTLQPGPGSTTSPSSCKTSARAPGTASRSRTAHSSAASPSPASRCRRRISAAAGRTSPESIPDSRAPSAVGSSVAKRIAASR